jgi:uncharacterized protein
MKQTHHSVFVAGTNIASKVNVIKIDVSLTEGHKADSASIEIDDKYGSIILPAKGVPVKILIGYTGNAGSVVFEGKVSEVKSSGSKDGGRTLSISATSTDQEHTSKQHRQKHSTKKKFGEAAQEIGKANGMTVKVHEGLGKIERDWWGQDNESFHAWGQRAAAELGAVFKVQGDRALFSPKLGGTVGGKTIPLFSAKYGDNLISWDMTPNIARNKYEGATGRHFDKKKAKWKKKGVKVKPDSDGSETEENAADTSSDEE